MSTAAPIAAQRAGRSSARAAIARLSVYVARSRAFYAIWVAVTLAYVATFLIVPELTGRTVGAIERGAPAAAIVKLALWLALVGSLSGVFRYYSRVLVFNAARQVEYEMRNDLFAHLQRLPQSFYLGWRTGDLMSRCVNDLNSVRMLLGPGLLSAVQSPLLYAGALAMMFSKDWQLALLVLLPYPVFIVLARGFGRALHRWNIAVQEGLGELSNQLQETISGIAVVKTHAMEGMTRARFARSNQGLFHKQLKLVRVSGAMPAITALLPSLAMLIILWVGGAKILAGRMQVEEFFTFAMLIYQLTFPTFIMGWAFSLIQRGAAAMQRIDEVLTTEPSIADRPDALAVGRLRGEIEFRNLTFRYTGSDREPALRDISLVIPAGTSLGIVGPVGAGKSTLASLIPRLFEVEDGRLFIDGIDVNRIALQALRSNIAMVPQDSFLFSMSIAENVAYGLREPDPKRVAQAVECAQLAKDLIDFPQGLATLVGERGVMLSGGQRQRTALARALALDPSILILDDTLSSVDAATEQAIQRGLAEVFTGRTAICISHRISSVRDCDQIVVLEGGRIAERGSHRELLLAGGFYARTARQQALEEELEEMGAVA
ncbi:MAG TPA: ABC transporter ATP-binding protein [Myxococcota bacterium]|nr:ABC transporter ATP-binding protein [Myxococcota bacterium]